MTVPITHLSPLHRADGSATYTSPSAITITASCSGPLEVPRRSDELPEECFVEVNIRPASGVGGVKERHLEKIVGDTVRAVLVEGWGAGRMVAVTLQVMRGGGQETSRSSYLPLLPALLQAAFLALLDASIPMTTTITSTIVAIAKDGEVVVDPDTKQRKMASSVHVFAFGGSAEMLVCESEGAFELGAWEEAIDVAKGVCCGDGDVAMEGQDNGDASEGMKGIVRQVVEEKVKKEERWRGTGS